MHGPTLVNWLLALLTATAGAYCLTRLRHAPGGPGSPPAPHSACAPATTRPTGTRRLLAREADAAEALMGLGMAGMAVTGAAVPAPVWAGLFGVPAAVFLLAAAGAPDHRGHRLHHAIGGLAMTYTALAMTASPSHHHHAPSTGAPLLTGALLVYFGAYSLWAGTRLLHAPGGSVTVGTAGLPQACRLTMGIGMFAMLLTM
ncbi:DUF5134 domain-containing protein [Kitasatospora sp. NPDC048722]|uniref:DUF5134 domain-containing protein n=1 Tax=Kitasatospora sp. NPDC048722 TaxID=3155639 RepID=UPI0033C315AF